MILNLKEPANHLAGRNNNLIRDLQFQIGYTQLYSGVTNTSRMDNGNFNASGLGDPSQTQAPNSPQGNLAPLETNNSHFLLLLLDQVFGVFSSGGGTNGLTRASADVVSIFHAYRG